MKHIYIVRDLFFDQTASLGTCFVYDEKNQLFKSESLERGWVNNENRVSCIPEGTYDVLLENSPKFNKQLWEIKGVPNRSECKFHAANYAKQLNGCIALGKSRTHLDGDLIMDISSSTNTMQLFHDVFKTETKSKLTVINLIKQ